MRVVLGPFHPELEDALVVEVTQQRQSDLLTPVLILVPSDPLLHRVKSLLARERQLNLLNLHVLTFHQLSRRLLEESGGTFPLELSSDAFTEEALRQMVETNFQWESVFSGIEAREGGCGALWQTLRDLKDAKVESQTSMDALAEGYLNAAGQKKLRDLFRLHGAFTAQMRERGIRDYTDVDALAAEQVSSSKFLQQFAAVIYYGFYDLTQIQLDLFRAVTRRAPATLLFPLVPGHPAWAFAQRFYDRHVQGMITGSPEVRFSTENRRHSFSLIQQRLFAEAESAPAEFKGSCTIVSCSGLKDEVLTVAKEILTLVYRDGFSFESIGVVARSTEPYLSWFQEIFADHGIPMATTAKSSILSFPMVKGVFLLGGLLTSDYLRSQVIDLLSSPYFNLGPYCAKGVLPRWDLWDPLTRQMGIVKGFDEWRRLERYLKGGVKLQGREEESEESYETPVTADQVKILWSIIEALHDDLERLPLEAAWSDFAMRWGALLFKYLGLERIEKSHPTSSREEKIGDIVLDTLDAMARLDRVSPRVSRVHFLRTFQRWLEQAEVSLIPWNLPGVAVLDAMSARGLPFRVLFLVGLNEGIVPRTIREDAFLRDSTRRGLETVLGYKISEKLAAYDEEKLILALLVGAVRERLYCLYRRADETGRALAQSWYLGEIRRAVWGPAGLVGSFGEPRDAPGETFVPRGIADKGKVAPFNEPQWLTARELAVQLALRGEDPGPVLELSSQAPAIYRRGLKSAEILEDPRGLLDRRDGMVGPVADYWQHLLERGVSPTALERYARCPFQYFAVNLLELREMQKPEEIAALGPSVIGQLCHSILKSLYSGLIEDGVFAGDLTKVAETNWRSRLDRIAQETYADYAKDNPVGYPLAWEDLREELTDLLGRVVERDLGGMAASGFRPVAVEPKWTGRLDEDWPEPMGNLLVVGTPDRMDCDPAESRYQVIDYKIRMGKHERPEDRNLLQSALRGKRLQLPLYALLAEQHASGGKREGRVRGILGRFYLIAPRWSDGPLVVESFPREAWNEPHKDRLQDTISYLLRGIREGKFFIFPGDHCRQCEVAVACRKNHWPSRWRAENNASVQHHHELGRQKATAVEGRRKK